MNAFLWKIARPIALALVFSWAVVLMGCGGSQAARKSPPQASDAEREAKERAEAERKAKEEAERAARAEAERKAKEEAEHAARAKAEAEEMARKARAFDESVHFDYDRYVIRDDQKPVLTRLVEKLRANPPYRVTIEGHADERGTPDYNLALGQKRAEAVKRLLVTKGKIDPGRVRTISYGETRPAAPDHTQVSWSKNRRAAFVIAESASRVETSGR
ncbi:MAG: hypothetical protein A3F84_00910 [Candidatus Handelsmanbacteria bacterium RIFCSPLOWO2_12_FULL_64_10]|uniref:Peptidoglycan-associated lipoprotein n=1 Tax=Handelsmanbacteria sp. (strain RIFCSPLOWO2_12_FULL_64_10) TaxID=1817868 RepID=A0A1F6C5P0_HANXR|nr:MAG: hypothetical protein A3F84_00910 [Candidatus Handelsmanbacteria bacterium RIFCSPLOWO2_12_FULL_64_10]